MKRLSLCGLVAAAGLWVSPAWAQESRPDILPHIGPHHSSHGTPSEDEEGAEEDHAAYEPTEQRAAGTVSLRLEYPTMLALDLAHARISYGRFYFDPDEEAFFHGNHNMEYLIDDLSVGNLADQLVFGGETFSTIQNYALHEIPEMTQRIEDRTNQYWGELRGALGNDEQLIGLELAVFFRDILPEYLGDGVISPDEAVEIEERVAHRIEDIHGRLDGDERRAVDTITESYSRDINSILEDYLIDDHLRALINNDDPLMYVVLGTLSLREYHDILMEAIPALDYTRDGNHARMVGRISGRLDGRTDRYSEWSFRTRDAILMQRHGERTEAMLEGNADVHIEAEYHGGRPLQDYLPQLDPRTAQTIDRLELILGYDPVTIDGTASARFRAHGRLENTYLDGYEAVVVRPSHHIGIGLAHGFRHRVRVDLDAWATAVADSFNDTVGIEAHTRVFTQEERARLVQAYLIWRQQDDRLWFGGDLGATWEDLTLDTEIIRSDASWRTTFSGEMESSSSVDHSTRRTRIIRITPAITMTGGVRAGPLMPYVYASMPDAASGVGSTLSLERVHIDANYALEERLRVRGRFALIGRFDRDETQRYDQERLLAEHSLFAGRDARAWDITQRHDAAQSGLFLDWELTFDARDDVPPIMLRAGIMLAEEGDMYVRLGYQGALSLRAVGSYAAVGSERFSLEVDLMYEEIPAVAHEAIRAGLRGRIPLGPLALQASGSGYLLSPATSRFMEMARGRFGVTYMMYLEGRF